MDPTHDNPPPAFNVPPVFDSLIPDPKSPQNVSTTVTWTANAHDNNGDTILYKFRLKGPLTGGKWQDVQDWSTAKFWDWTPSQQGDYAVEVWIIDGKHNPESNWDDCEADNYKVTEDNATKENAPPVFDSLIPDPKSPQNVSTTVTWTANAHDNNGDTILYKFRLKGPSTGGKWQDVQDWSTAKSWDWTPFQQGDYAVEVWIRDGKHNPESNWDDYETDNYKVTEENTPPVFDSLIPDPKSPQNVSTTVTWTANAHDNNGDTILYKFRLKGPSTGGKWQDVQDWSTAKSWDWTPFQQGDYAVEVWIRDGKHNPESNRRNTFAVGDQPSAIPPQTPQVTRDDFMKHSSTSLKENNIDYINLKSLEQIDTSGNEFNTWKIGSDENVDKSVLYKFEYTINEGGGTDTSVYHIELYLDDGARPMDVKFFKHNAEIPTIPKADSDIAISSLSFLVSRRR